MSADKHPKRALVYVRIFFLLAAAILATAYFTYAAMRDTLRVGKQADLAAIALLKTDQIADWVNQRRKEVRIMAADTENTTGFERWLAQGAQDNETRQHLLANLANTSRSADHRNILLVDPEGNVRLRTDSSPAKLDETSRQLVLESMKSGKILMSELHRHEDEPGQPACLSFVAPLIVDGASPRTVGALVLQLDPERFLFPLVQGWPVPSQSAETLLIKLNGDQVTHLSRPRHPTDETYSRKKTAHPDAPAYLASQGKIGEGEGTDYRGVPVVASVHAIPGTPWHLISKMDKQELYASINQLALISLAFTLIFLAIATGLVFMWWRQNKMNFALRLQANSERARQEWESVFDAMSNPIFLHDPAFRIIRANQAYALAAGRNLSEIIGQPYWHFFPRRDGPLASCLQAMHLKQEDREEFNVGEQIYTSRGFPVQFNSQSGFSVHILEDITESRRAQLMLQRNMQAMAAMSAGNLALVQAKDEKSLLDEMCRIIVETSGYSLAWVGYAQQDAEKTVQPMAQAGFKQGYLDDVQLTWAGRECALGPCGEVIRSGKTSIAHDILGNPELASWREAAIEFGYTASIALPLKEEGRTFGVLSIYTASVEAFAADEVKLLEEMSGDLAFGIMNLRNDLKRQEAEATRNKVMEQLRLAMEDTIGAIAATLERRDPYTAGHQRRVAQLGVAIAQELGLPEEEIEGIHFGGLIHDLGKIAVPAEILSKPGKISAIEFGLIKTHAEVGYEIVKGIAFPWPVAEMVHQHHERLDGSGYPQGLKGEEITHGARILAVADVVEAMSSNRPYRPSLGVEPALEEITRNRGKFYDPDAVDACLKLFREKEFRFD